MATEKIELAEGQAVFVHQNIASGRFESVSDAVRAGLVLLEERVASEQQREDALRGLLAEAKAGGVSDRDPREAWAAVTSQHKSGNA